MGVGAEHHRGAGGDKRRAARDFIAVERQRPTVQPWRVAVLPARQRHAWAFGTGHRQRRVRHGDGTDAALAQGEALYPGGGGEFHHCAVGAARQPPLAGRAKIGQRRAGRAQDPPIRADQAPTGVLGGKHRPPARQCQQMADGVARGRNIGITPQPEIAPAADDVAGCSTRIARRQQLNAAIAVPGPGHRQQAAAGKARGIGHEHALQGARGDHVQAQFSSLVGSLRGNREQPSIGRDS